MLSSPSCFMLGSAPPLCSKISSRSVAWSQRTRISASEWPQKETLRNENNGSWVGSALLTLASVWVTQFYANTSENHYIIKFTTLGFLWGGHIVLCVFPCRASWCFLILASLWFDPANHSGRLVQINNQQSSSDRDPARFQSSAECQWSHLTKIKRNQSVLWLWR